MILPEIHFLISAPRSGSTWLAQALNQHPEIFATEQRLFGNFCEMWPNNNGKLAPRITLDAYARAVSVHYFHQEISETRAEFTDRFIREYCQFLMKFAADSTGKTTIVDKITPYPGTTKFVLKQIQSFFPDSKIIKLVRDGRDVLTSGTFDWMLKEAQGTSRYKCFVEHDESVEVRRFFDDDTIRKWAGTWSETVMHIRQPDLELRYERMLKNLSVELARIYELLGVDATEQIADQCAQAVTFEQMTGRSNGQMDPTAKQRNGVEGDWKHYFTERDGQLFHELAGDQLLATQYINADNWFVGLPEALSIRWDNNNSTGATQT